jgi:DNA polymerase epsilon subunit 1
MYPNIILSNRLQPVAIVNEETCAGCLFNQDKNRCKRHLDWQWKGEMFPLSRLEFQRIKLQLEEEDLAAKQRQSSNARDSGYGRGSSGHTDKKKPDNTGTFEERLRARIKAYCQRSYKQVHARKQELRQDTVCMRENPFYVDTVRDFRDRRYEFKRLTKTWGGKMKEALKAGDGEAAEVAKNRATLYDSLQLAHKIILNSFYGYVMKKGARWYSMEIAAMVTHTGGCIITESRQLFDLIGMPLELDTDGIWTLLPKGFPESYAFELTNGKKITFDFPCTMCNNLIYEKYGNDQYQTKRPGSLQYDIRNEMSVFFEIDGPYRCMLIPAAKEEGKMLKKRYAVFNHAGKMTEVKGFELKRRGELKIIKIFQEEVFGRFLEGGSLQECYDACGEVGKRWYEILEQEGGGLEDEELIEYIGEERVISKKLSAYGNAKSTSITCAHRLAEFLGPAMLRDDAGGLNVKFIISKKPIDAKVAARAIPTIIFQEKQQIKEKYLKKWTKDTNLKDYDLASILDWDYYKERLGGSIQKIITIPAFLQKCMNPIPQIAYPNWLYKMKMAQDDKFKQKGISQFYKTIRIPKPGPRDIEDMAK